MAAAAARPHGFSLKEAAVLSNVPERSIRKALELRTIMPRATRVGRVPRYRFSAHDLLYLALVHDFPIALSTADRTYLWQLFDGPRTADGPWRWDHHDLVARHGDLCLRVDTQPLKTRLLERLRAFRLGRRRIIRDPAILSGEPVFEGTRIPLALIAGMLRKGVALEEIREDYPSLDEGDLAYAELIARMKPEPGRPRKPLTLRRAVDPATTPGRRHAAAGR